MNEEEAVRFVKDMRHAMCCLAHRKQETQTYSRDFGEKVCEIHDAVMEEVEDG